MFARQSLSKTDPRTGTGHLSLPHGRPVTSYLNYRADRREYLHVGR